MKNLKILSILILAVSLFSFQGAENEKEQNKFDFVDSEVVTGYTKAKVTFVSTVSEEYKQQIRDEYTDYYGPFRITQCLDGSEIWEWRFPVNATTGESTGQTGQVKEKPLDGRPGHHQVIWDNNASC